MKKTVSRKRAKTEAKGKIVIVRDRCKGCELCIFACPRDCLAISRKMNKLGYYPVEVIKPDGCTGCALCAVMCPDVCIEVYSG